jgi:NAD(P) transhydrogenase subunit alpha
MPQMMTAAGTVAPAKVFVMGAGVAGLQAIATARRLGAIVTATDVRPATEEQVASLGAKFIAVKNEEFEQAQTAGGYAKEMSDDYKKQQAELVAGHIAKQDIVITTALIPGRKAPILSPRTMVASMKPGSIIVDLAVEQGGNVEGAELDKVAETAQRREDHRVPNMAGPAGRRRVLAVRPQPPEFPDPLHQGGQARAPDEDELVKGIRLTRDGAVVHPNLVKEGLSRGRDEARQLREARRGRAVGRGGAGGGGRRATGMAAADRRRPVRVPPRRSSCWRSSSAITSCGRSRRRCTRR